MARERLLIVGNGMAGLKLCEELVARGASIDITVVGAEPEPAYNRVLLSPLLAGEIGIADVRMKSRGWYEDHGIALMTGDAVARLDISNCCATLESGRVLSFDRCVMATGSDPIRLRIPGHELRGVMTFRSLADIAVLTTAAQAKTPAVVIGGGLLGIEAAYGLARAGVKVTLVHLMDRLMERQLDAEASQLLRAALEAKGIDVCLAADTAAIHGTTHVESLELKNGHGIPCGLVVMAVGVRPNTALASASGLEVKRGIVVDDALTTSVERVYAIGECAEHRGQAYGLVEPAYEQARVLANVLTGTEAAYPGSVLATNLKVSGVPVFSAGDFEGHGAEQIVVSDSSAPSYRKLVVRDGKLAGVVLAGDTTDALWYLELIRSGAEITAHRPTLAFGRAYSEAA
jgi:nitrite reductase (NADH) large subunit